MEDVNKAITKRLNKEIRIKGWTKEKFNKEMKKSSRWITKVQSERREWTVNNLLNACRVLEIQPSSLMRIRIKKINLCDMSIKEVLQIMLKENCNHFIEENPDKISMILDFIKLMTKEVKI